MINNFTFFIYQNFCILNLIIAVPHMKWNDERRQIFEFCLCANFCFYYLIHQLSISFLYLKWCNSSSHMEYFRLSIAKVSFASSTTDASFFLGFITCWVWIASSQWCITTCQVLRIHADFVQLKISKRNW